MWHGSDPVERLPLSAASRSHDGRASSPYPFPICLAYIEDSRLAIASVVCACGSCHRPLSCHITWRCAARRAPDAETRSDARSRHVRHHRHVRRRYFARRTASRATPTMTSTTANIAMAAMISMAITPSFDQYGARFGDAERQCRHSAGLARRVPQRT